MHQEQSGFLEELTNCGEEETTVVVLSLVVVPSWEYLAKCQLQHSCIRATNDRLTCALAKDVDFGFRWTSRISLRALTTMTVADGLGTAGWARWRCFGPPPFASDEDDIARVERECARGRCLTASGMVRPIRTGLRSRESRRRGVMVAENRPMLCLAPHWYR